MPVNPVHASLLRPACHPVIINNYFFRSCTITVLYSMAAMISLRLPRAYECRFAALILGGSCAHFGWFMRSCGYYSKDMHVFCCLSTVNGNKLSLLVLRMCS